LIRTKLRHPRLPEDLVPRPRLLDRLHAGSDRKLTLISAMAGAGKTTLVAQWLEECSQPSAWLSLDERDNDPIVFLSYLCGAIRTVFPSACENSLGFLKAPHTPPTRVFIASIINELDELVEDSSQSLAPPPEAGGGSAAPSQAGGPSAKGMILALDDYHTITEPAIHEILSSLIEHLPQGMHLALATRTDPRLPLAGWRARRQMTEIRSLDLRFTSEEAHAFLEGTTGRELNRETIRLLESKTEGWVVGLRLAALSLRTRPNGEAFVQGFKGTSSDLVVEYLLGEVLARQSAEIQDFVLRTSVLDRFCASLSEALTGVSAAKSQEIIEWVARANLFLVPLDQEGGWYRYHHLFRDVLRHKLKQQYSPAEISRMQARAAAWFAENGLVDEALDRFLAADDRSAAAALVARHRTEMLNQAQWSRLERWTRRFSADIIDQHPDILMLKTWLLYHHTRYAELPASLERLEASLARVPLAPVTVDQLQGEIDALRSLLAYLAVDAKATIVYAQGSLERTRPDLWIVRSLARLTLALALQMRGDLRDAYAAIYDGFAQEEVSDPEFKATLLLTACFVYWMAADLQGLAQAAVQCIAQSQDAESPEIGNYGHYHLGSARYQHNDLAGAERHFSTVCQQPYRNYGDCLVYGTCGLALTRQAQGHPEEARAAAKSAVNFMLETGNTTLLAEAQALQAELALMQGKIATASRWAAQLDPVPPLSPVYGFFSQHLTLVKILLAQDTPASWGRAADLLGQLQAFFESTHNTRFSIEVLALQALLQDRRGEQETALELIEQAVALAEPGGFIRLFVDLGPSLKRLLDRLRRQGVAPNYITQILNAFEMMEDEDAKSSSLVLGPSSPLVEPLTPRELVVLALLDRRLTNQEIAEELVVSPSTVKTHTLNIYRKLEVHSRKQAVARATELDILPPNVM
jgi:LuxR family maltose regulon positive regulatory protein